MGQGRGDLTAIQQGNYSRGELTWQYRDNALGVCHGKTEVIQCRVQAEGVAQVRFLGTVVMC